MFGQPTPFPWWLWILAGLWTGGIVLRRIRPVSRETGWLLDGLIVSYTVLLTYMTVRAATGGMASPGWIRAGWWTSGGLSLGGGLLCLLGSTPMLRTRGWILCGLGLTSLCVWLRAPELAVLCAAAGVIGGLRRLEPTETPADEHHEEDLRPSAPLKPEGWLVAAMATAVCVAWLGVVEYAYRVEWPRAGDSPRLTALPAVQPQAANKPDEPTPATYALVGVIVICAILEARPDRSTPEDPAE